MRRIVPVAAGVILLAACSTVESSALAPTDADLPAPGVINAPPAESTADLLPTISPTRSLLFPESLTTAELHVRLDPFGAAYPECFLPCYNGLIMGRSTTPDVYDFYARLGIGIPDLIPGDYPAIQDGTGRLGAWLTKSSDAASAAQMGLAAPLVSIYVLDNVAETLYVGWEYYPDYLTIPRIVEQMGAPDFIDLALIFGDEAVLYLLRMLYSDRQTGFAFYGEAVGDNAIQQMCFDKAHVRAVTLGLYKPGLPPLDGLQYGEYLLPIDQTLGLTNATFIEQVTAGSCIEAPAAAWPAWQDLEGQP